MLRCAECRVRLYDIPSGEQKFYEVDDEDGPRMLPMLRDTDPPCGRCPKGGPQNDTLYDLSSRNWEAYLLYRRLEATFGQYELPDYLRRCEVFAENMRLVKVAIQNGESRAKSNAYEESRRETGEVS